MSPLQLLKNIEQLSVDEISNIKDIGPVVARSIYDWFLDQKNREFIKDLEDAGIQIELPKTEIGRQTLKDKSFVLTGELKSLSREEAKEKIRERGGETNSSVSKNTDYVVVGENPGSKYDQAKKLGVKIINENEFQKLLK